MSRGPQQHDPDHSDLVVMYVMGTLPASEIPAVQRTISECVDCRRELESYRPVIDTFASWPTDILRPSQSLWARVAQRLPELVGNPTFSEPQRWVEPDWKEVAPGIFCTLLATDEERARVSMLVRLAPGVDYPPHTHAGLEELHLLYGELWINDRKLYPGDYNRAEPGTADQRVWSETGCTCVLVTSTKDVLR